MHAAAKLFCEITEEWPDSKDKIKEVSCLEIRCDAEKVAILEELNRSFITPFDREDLNTLARDLDEIVDMIESIAARYELFDVHVMIPEAARIAGLIAEETNQLSIVFEHMSNFKKDPTVSDAAKQVLAIEDEGDIVYRNALGSIFDASVPPIHIIKWKSLLDAMEDVADKCRDVADTVLAVIMKNA